MQNKIYCEKHKIQLLSVLLILTLLFFCVKTMFNGQKALRTTILSKIQNNKTYITTRRQNFNQIRKKFQKYLVQTAFKPHQEKTSPTYFKEHNNNLSKSKIIFLYKLKT